MTPLEQQERQAFLASLPAVLADASRADVLVRSLAPVPAGLRLETSFDGRSLELVLEPPVDAAALCDGWELPAAVTWSGDVHQRRWHVSLRGDELVTPIGTGRAVDTRSIGWGRWRVTPVLAGRPGGPPPEISVGASPAHDVRRGGCVVAAIEITGADESTGRFPDRRGDGAPEPPAGAAQGRRWWRRRRRDVSGS